jgi:hypothetical protein
VWGQHGAIFEECRYPTGMLGQYLATRPMSRPATTKCVTYGSEKENRPPGITVVATLMILFGLAEVFTGLFLGHRIGVSEANSTVFAYETPLSALSISSAGSFS